MLPGRPKPLAGDDVVGREYIRALPRCDYWRMGSAEVLVS
jgi:hypothetical protein